MGKTDPDKFNSKDAASEYNRKAHNKEVLDKAKKVDGGHNGYTSAVNGLNLEGRR